MPISTKKVPPLSLLKSKGKHLRNQHIFTARERECPPKRKRKRKGTIVIPVPSRLFKKVFFPSLPHHSLSLSLSTKKKTKNSVMQQKKFKS